MSKAWVRALAASLLAMHTWWASAVWAQADDAQARRNASAGSGPPSSLPEAYTRAVRLALQEYEVGNYAEARARFLEAHRAFPNARSLRFLGKVEYDLQNYLASIDYLQRSLASERRPLDPELRADVEWLLEMARGYVATYTVLLSPDQAQLEVDGVAVQDGPKAVLPLQVGEHTLAAHAPGYRSQHKVIEVASGNDASVELRLQRLPELTTHDRRRRRWLGCVAGIVLAAVATGVGLSQRGTTVDDPDGGSVGATLYKSGP